MPATATAADRGLILPAQLADATRAALATKASELRRQLRCHELAIPLDGLRDLPADLAGQVADHNGLAAELEQRQQAVAEAVADLPLAMADPEVKAEQLEERAAALRRERYDLAQAHVDVVTARKPLLREVANYLEHKILPGVQATVEKATKAADKALRKARRGPEDRPAWEQNREIAQRQFDYEVRQDPDVRAAQADVEALRKEIRRLREKANAVDHDAVVVGQVVVAAFRALAAGLPVAL